MDDVFFDRRILLHSSLFPQHPARHLPRRHSVNVIDNMSVQRLRRQQQTVSHSCPCEKETSSLAPCRRRETFHVLSVSQYKIYQLWTCYFCGLRGGPQVANVPLCCHLFRVLWHKKFIIYQKRPALYFMSLDLPTKLALRFVNHQQSLVLCSGQWWSFKFCGRQYGTLESAQETWDSSDFTSNWLSGLRHLIQLLLICFLICKMRELN